MGVCAELCRYAAADGERLHGLLFHPREELPQPDLALLMLHGVGSNFYTSHLPLVAEALAGDGYHSLSSNTRGHDYITRSGGRDQIGGAAFEMLEDCLLDVDAALEYLKGRGYSRFVLVGQSLGSVKSVYYQGTRQRSDVVGVVSYSCPRLFYSSRVNQHPAFKQRLDEAQAMIDAGRGEELIWDTDSARSRVFSARTYVNKYGPHDNFDLRPYAAKLGVPFLAVAGSEDASKPIPFYAKQMVEAAQAAGSTSASYHIVQGSGHGYEGHEPEAIEKIREFLARLPA
jgi:pimeloyl-ACP methyl ester carboxylesterase